MCDHMYSPGNGADNLEAGPDVNEPALLQTQENTTPEPPSPLSPRSTTPELMMPSARSNVLNAELHIGRETKKAPCE